jgi:putative MATE family efflux protein
VTDKHPQHSLTHGSVPLLLRRIAYPAAVGTVFNTFYNVVDTFWAGQVSTESLAALSLNFPIFLIALSVGVGFSAGTAALISNFLGADNTRDAHRIYYKAISFALILHIAMMIPLFIFLEQIFLMLDAEPNVLPRALAYGRVIVAGSIFISATMTFNAALNARGDTKTYRNVLIAGFFLNLGLDPLFMYGLSLGSFQVIPAMEETGIALATILIQLASSLYLLHVQRKRGLFASFSIIRLRPDIPSYRHIASQVFPAMANFLIMATGTLVITFFISRYGTVVVAAYGSAVRVEQIALVPSSGLATALAALTGQNNGAGFYDRVNQSYRTALLYGLFLMALLLTPVLLFGRSILDIFTDSQQVIDTGYEYLLIQGITFYSYILLFLSNALLQGMKKPNMVMWMGLYRQIAAPALVFSLLSMVLGLQEKGVWWGLVIVNWSAAIITFAYARSLLHKKLAAS